VHEPQAVVEALPLHKAVLDAVLAHRQENAEAAMRAIILSARRDIERHLSEDAAAIRGAA
jgi:DNA-binding GntR family transcriptional regulator